MSPKGRLAGLFAVGLIVSCTPSGVNGVERPGVDMGTPTASAGSGYGLAEDIDRRVPTPTAIKQTLTPTPPVEPTVTPAPVIDFAGGTYPDGFLDVEGNPTSEDVLSQQQEFRDMVAKYPDWFAADPEHSVHLRWIYFVDSLGKDNKFSSGDRVKVAMEAVDGSGFYDMTDDGQPLQILTDREGGDVVTFSWAVNGGKGGWGAFDPETGKLLEYVDPKTYEWTEVRPTATGTPAPVATEAVGANEIALGPEFVEWGNLRVKLVGEGANEIFGGIGLNGGEVVADAYVAEVMGLISGHSEATTFEAIGIHIIQPDGTVNVGPRMTVIDDPPVQIRKDTGFDLVLQVPGGKLSGFGIGDNRLQLYVGVDEQDRLIVFAQVDKAFADVLAKDQHCLERLFAMIGEYLASANGAARGDPQGPIDFSYALSSQEAVNGLNEFMGGVYESLKKLLLSVK